MVASRLPKTFSVGTVLGDTFAVLGRNLFGFVLLAVLVLAAVVALQFVPDWGSPSEAQTADNLSRNLLGFVLANGLLWLVGVLLVSAVVAHGVARDRSGDRASIAALITPVLRGLPVMALVMLMGVVPITVAFLLFILPALVLMVFWWVILPASALEGRATSSFARSWALTRGHRLKVLGLIVVLFGGLFVLSVVINFILGVVITFFALSVINNGGPGPESFMQTALLANILVGSGLVGLAAIVISAASTVSFLDLRDIKEIAGANAAAPNQE